MYNVLYLKLIIAFLYAFFNSFSKNTFARFENEFFVNYKLWFMVSYLNKYLIIYFACAIINNVENYSFKGIC